MPQFPMLGASPDAIGNDFIIEIKCPSKKQRVANYFPNGKISRKCKAQMQLQMLATKTKKASLCVATPDFEETGNIDVYLEELDQEFVDEIVRGGIKFGETHIPTFDVFCLNCGANIFCNFMNFQ